MALTDVDARRADLNAAIATYTQTRADFAEGTATQTDVDNAKVAAQQAGDALAKEMGATKAADPSIPEDDFFSNVNLMGADKRADVATIMRNGVLERPAIWRIDTNANTQDSRTFTLPVQAGTNLEVDWGDGTVETVTAARAHEYAVPGVYDIKLKGVLNGMSLPPASQNTVLTEVVQWGDLSILSAYRLMANRKNVHMSATDSPRFGPDCDAEAIFNSAANMTGSVNHWDMSTVARLKDGIFNNPTFSLDISGWNVSNVVNMNYMLYGAAAFDHDLSNWDVSKVSYYSNFAHNCPIDGTAKMPNFV